MARIIKPLSPLQIKNAKPKEKPYKLFDGSGLYMEVTPIGSKLWRMKIRIDNRERLLSFGKYPDVSLEQARARRDEARKQKAAGIDPGEAKKRQKREKAEKAANTFEKIAREWHSNRLETWQPNTARDILQRLEKDIFPEIGNLPVSSITHKQLIDTLRKIESRGAHEIAKRLKANCARIFSYAIQHGLTDRNIANDLTEVLKPVRKGHFASITTEELPAFLKAMNQNDARLYMPTRIALRLMLLLFLRTSELIETPWSEINLETGEWVIPWNRMKRGKLAMNPDKTDHHVCMSKQALTLLRELHSLTGGSKWLFPNQRDPQKPMSNGAILMAIRRMGYQNQMTGHGFRALAMSTIKEKLHYRHEVVDRQLAHAQKNKVDSAYDRAMFLDERKKMMQDWADYLDELQASKI
ncbi:integrase arm-type DNA-binding domain-containing protein [Oxalobacter vibrioformis]|uniref:Integrase arm-type DNA-binding domain-containing protein n=1 Tax=Oxalobacter vibrioformis TaxID=933080 RepID=A0A9E9LY17_9BURK|nr:integrase arm-type DNA-binding domain-containing protein [Oxalobacter vibrioformis]WAW10406.1 integrase arm-type DNA-binding domain-containing protein [Oxalobacter vibrioformis]